MHMICNVTKGGSLCLVNDFQQFLWFLAEQRRMIENLWQEFFSDPSQWWDHRLEKVMIATGQRKDSFATLSGYVIIWLSL